MEDSKKYLIPLSGRQINLILKALRVAALSIDEEEVQYELYKFLNAKATELK